ncbi:MAG: hypothetical protein ACREK6_21330, partial [Candidatus Rokuibacteriota bacterium]
WPWPSWPGGGAMLAAPRSILEIAYGLFCALAVPRYVERTERIAAEFDVALAKTPAEPRAGEHAPERKRV